jgi:hypothetical protein
MAATMALFAVLVWRVGFNREILTWFSTAMMTWLFLCSIFALANLRDIALTAPALFGCLAWMIAVKVKDLECDNLSALLAFMSIVNLALAVAMLTNDSVGQFIINYYNDFTDTLVADMLANEKPVLTFATHSLAGLFAYLFFWLNLRTYQKRGTKLHLLLAVLHVGLCIALKSFTSLGLGALAVLELFWRFPKTVLASAIASFFMIPASAKDIIGDSFTVNVMLRDGGGFISRYTQLGNLANIFAFIHEHPFGPIGVLYSSKLFADGGQTDSGPILYFLRGSLPLLLLVYGGFFLFLWRNVRDRWACWRLFLVIVLTELGITVLIYPRSFLLIPFFVVYLNSLEAPSRVRQCNRWWRTRRLLLLPAESAPSPYSPQSPSRPAIAALR